MIVLLCVATCAPGVSHNLMFSGFSFLVLHAILLQSLTENRTLLPLSAVLGGHHWRWCHEGSRDVRDSAACTFPPN